MLTPGKIIREAALWPVLLALFAWQDRWGWFAWVGLWFAVHCGLTIALWISEAEVREMAAEGYVEGEPLLMHYRFDPKRFHEVTYVEPAHGCHKVRLVGVNGVDTYVQPERLHRPRTDLKGTEAHLPS